MERITLLLSFVALLHVQIITAHSGCHSYINISEVWRSTANEIKPGTKPKCDRDFIVDDMWYRFYSPAGNEMPMEIIAFRKCGTFMPIWLKGGHPKVADGDVDRKACVNVPFRHPLGCGISYSIKVANCSGFYVYKLKTPQQCASAYCAGIHTIYFNRCQCG